MRFLIALVADFAWVTAFSLVGLLLTLGFSKWKRVFLMLARKTSRLSDAVHESIRFSERMRTQSKDLEKQISETEDPFLKECFGLVRDRTLTTEELRSVLKAKVRASFEDDQILHTMLKAKTAVPFVTSVLAALGFAAYNLQNGQSVAWHDCCLLMFWGVFLSYFGIQNCADRFFAGAMDLRRRRTMIAIACRSVSERANPFLMAEELNAFLPQVEKVDWDQVARSLRLDSTSNALPQGASESGATLPHGF